MPEQPATDPDLHVLADGARIRPVPGPDDAFTFRLPHAAREIRLVSRTARPEQLGLAPDDRQLGVAVIRLDVAGPFPARSLALDDETLVEGFHPAEPGPLRWTNGDALLPAALFAGPPGERVLTLGCHFLPRYSDQDDRAAADKALFLGFESLGEDCEFGLAQRHFHAEPTSLLRWSRIDAARLRTALAADLAGIGDPATTRLEWDAAVSEYKLRGPSMSAHTWAKSPCATPEEANRLHAAGCARLRLLARKLLADIAQPRRIFVYASGDPEFGLAAVLRLHEALRRIGPAPLLCVRHAARESDIGRVERLRPGLYLGHIDQFVLERGPYEIWHIICAQARLLHDAG